MIFQDIVDIICGFADMLCLYEIIRKKPENSPKIHLLFWEFLLIMRFRHKFDLHNGSV